MKFDKRFEGKPARGCAPHSSFSLPAAALAVLDSNVVFDWLVFRDPRIGVLVRALEAGHLRWIVSAECRAEVAHVLDRGALDAYGVDRAAFWLAWEQASVTVPSPGGQPFVAPPLRCTDADDQKFLDLALHRRARWLFTRDRALLKLARRARAFGMDILEPERWSSPSDGKGSEA